MNEKVVLALIEPVGSHGGMDYYDSGLCAGVSKNGIDTVWYTSDISTPRGEAKVKIERTFVGIWGKSASWLRGVRYLKGLVRTLIHAKRRSTNVVHLHFFHVGALESLTVILSRLFFMKVVTTVHDVESFKPGGRSRFFRSISYGLSTFLIVHNKVSSRELINKCNVNPSKVKIIGHGSYLGLVESKIDKTLARSLLGLPSIDKKIILFFGQIKEVKGLDVLLHAFSKCRSSIDPCSLVIAGKVWKDSFDKYINIIESERIQGFVDCRIRYIPDSEVSAYYSAADLIVLPYKKIYQSGVLLMAMSYGTPVLASDIPGMCEVIDSGRNGYLFKSEDVAALSDAIVDLISDPESMAAMAEEALLDMKNEYSWETIGTKLASVYLECILKR